MIRKAERDLRERWLARFLALPPEALEALCGCLYDLRHDALARAQHQWEKHKAPMALYWKVVGVYAGHLARTIQRAQALSSDRRQRA